MQAQPVPSFPAAQGTHTTPSIHPGPPGPTNTSGRVEPELWSPEVTLGVPCLATFGQRVALGVLLLPHPSPSWGRCLPSPVLAKVVGVARGG